jgi:hypothetical protein
MMKLLSRSMLVFAASMCIASSAFAQSAKHAIQISNLTLIEPTASTPGTWVTILGAVDPSDPNAVTIHTSQLKDLLFSVSLECGLYTRTLARSKGGEKDTATAEARVQVRVVLDPGTPQERIAEPGVVTFCERLQSLSATLQGIIGNLACFPGGVFDPNAPGCTLTPEEIELVLNTLEANAFFFALDDVGAGTHNVIVQARIRSATSVQAGEAEALALIGKGTVVVEEIRLVKGRSITIQ